MTLRVPISYAVGLALVLPTACSSMRRRAPVPARRPASQLEPDEPCAGHRDLRVAVPVDVGSRGRRPRGRTIEITVTGREVDPAPSTVSLGVGDRLTLLVTSDHDDTLHIHGFDVEEPLTAGAATSVTLTGAQPGVYEVETHHPELRLLKIAVR